MFNIIILSLSFEIKTSDQKRTTLSATPNRFIIISFKLVDLSILELLATQSPNQQTLLTKKVEMVESKSAPLTKLPQLKLTFKLKEPPTLPPHPHPSHPLSAKYSKTQTFQYFQFKSNARLKNL